MIYPDLDLPAKIISTPEEIPPVRHPTAPQTSNRTGWPVAEVMLTDDLVQATPPVPHTGSYDDLVRGWLACSGPWRLAGVVGACVARVGAQDDWRNAERDVWVARLDEAIARCKEPPVLVAHSLGSLTVAHWVADGARRPVCAALLVTPADVEHNVTPEIVGFDPIPRTVFPFPTIVVASQNDRWMTPDRALSFAKAWGARFVDAGEVGHLTVSGGYGPWPDGERILGDLLVHDAAGGAG